MYNVALPIMAALCLWIAVKHFAEPATLLMWLGFAVGYAGLAWELWKVGT